MHQISLGLSFHLAAFDGDIAFTAVLSVSYSVNIT